MFNSKKLTLFLLIAFFSMATLYPISAAAQIPAPYSYSGIKPFGGRIVGIEACQKPAAILLKIGPPMGGNFLLTDSSKIYMYGNTSKGIWMLGNAGTAPVKCMGKRGLLSINNLIKIVVIAVAIYYTGGAFAGATTETGGAAGLTAGLEPAAGTGLAAPDPAVGMVSPLESSGPMLAPGGGGAGAGASTGAGIGSAAGGGGMFGARAIGFGALAGGISSLTGSLPFGKKLKNLGTGYIIQIVGTSLSP